MDHRHFSPTAWAADVRYYLAEIEQLRQRLGSAQAEQALHSDQLRRSEQLRRWAEQSRSRQQSETHGRINALKRQNELLEHEACEESQVNEQRSEILRSKLDAAQQSIRASSRQVDVLRDELRNVALAASSEQSELADRHQSFVECHQLVVDQKDTQIETLETQVAIFENLQSQYDLFRKQASDAFGICDDEIELLDATIEILRTDHEAVELVAADLDHQNDKLQCTIGDLQRTVDKLDQQIVDQGRERDMLNRRIEQLQTSRLQAVRSIGRAA